MCLHAQLARRSQQVLRAPPVETRRTPSIYGDLRVVLPKYDDSIVGEAARRDCHTRLRTPHGHLIPATASIESVERASAGHIGRQRAQWHGRHRCPGGTDGPDSLKVRFALQ